MPLSRWRQRHGDHRARSASPQTPLVGRCAAAVPGLTVAGRVPGTVTAVFPRGGESDYTLVLVDGVPRQQLRRRLRLRQVPIGDVERIEVVRGPQSALYGSDAIGARRADRHAARRPACAAASSSRRGSSARARRRVDVRGSRRLRMGRVRRPARRPTASRRDSGRRTDGHQRRLRQTRADVRRPAGATRGTACAARSSYAMTSAAPPARTARIRSATSRRGSIDARGDNRRTAGGLAFCTPLVGGASGCARQSALQRGSTATSPARSAIGGVRAARWHGGAQIDVTVSPGWRSRRRRVLRERAGSTYITGGDRARCRWSALVGGYFAEARWQPHERLFVTAGARAERIRRDRARRSRRIRSRRGRRSRRHRRVGQSQGDGAWIVRPAARATPRRSAPPRAPASARPTPSSIAFTDNPGLEARAQPQRRSRRRLRRSPAARVQADATGSTTATTT